MTVQLYWTEWEKPGKERWDAGKWWVLDPNEIYYVSIQRGDEITKIMFCDLKELCHQGPFWSQEHFTSHLSNSVKLWPQSILAQNLHHSASLPTCNFHSERVYTLIITSITITIIIILPPPCSTTPYKSFQSLNICSFVTNFNPFTHKLFKIIF